MQERESRIRKAIRWLNMFLFLLLPLAIIPILASWVGDIAKDYLVKGAVSSTDRGLFWAGFAGLLILAAVIVWKGRKLLPARVIEQTPSFEQRRVVVALLSPCNDLEQDNQGGWQMLDKSGKTLWSMAGETLDELVRKETVLPGLTWQQALRAAHYHKTRLEKLVLVGSIGGSGEKKQLNLANEFFSTFFPGKVAIFGSPSLPGVDYDARWQADFEDLSGSSNLLRNILRELHKDTAHYTDRDIIIDCTGGQKTAGIAAALVTLHRPDLMFQYVGTGEHAGQVTGFNVATEAYQD
jgi:hypothetical protein